MSSHHGLCVGKGGMRLVTLRGQQKPFKVATKAFALSASSEEIIEALSEIFERTGSGANGQSFGHYWAAPPAYVAIRTRRFVLLQQTTDNRWAAWLPSLEGFDYLAAQSSAHMLSWMRAYEPLILTSAVEVSTRKRYQAMPTLKRGLWCIRDVVLVCLVGGFDLPIGFYEAIIAHQVVRIRPLVPEVVPETRGNSGTSSRAQSSAVSGMQTAKLLRAACR